MRRLLPTLVSACAISLVAGCDGSSTTASNAQTIPGPDPKAWASDVCSLLAGAGEASARPFREAQAELQSATEFESRRVRRLVVRAALMSARVDDEIIAKYDAIGAPAVEDGMAIQRTLRANLVRIRDLALDARERARTLPVDTTEHFLAALKVFSMDFIERSRDLFAGTSNLERFDSPALKEAIENDPTCKTL